MHPGKRLGDTSCAHILVTDLVLMRYEKHSNQWDINVMVGFDSLYA